MDDMNIDEIVEVPDTPDRFPKQGINGRSGFKVENRCSSYSFNGQPKFSEEGTRDQPMLIDSGSRGRSMHPPKRTNSPSNSRRLNSFAVFPSSSSSSSSRNALFCKGVVEKNPKRPSHDSTHNQHPPSMRPSKISFPFDNGGFPDSTELNLHKSVVGNASKSGMPGNNQGDFRKRSGLNNGPSLHGLQNLSIGSSIACKEGVDFVGNDNKKPGNAGFLSIDPLCSPKVNRQKRLVRNGCISPNNIAKVKQSAGKEIDGSVAVAHNDVSVGSSAPPISTGIRELVAEESDSHTKKGKGVISVPCSSKGPDFHHKNLHSRYW